MLVVGFVNQKGGVGKTYKWMAQSG